MNIHSIVLAAAVALITIGVMLAWINLRGGDDSIRQLILRCPDGRKPQLNTTTGTQPDPMMNDSNHFGVPLNGEELFPAMLAAIRGKEPSLTFDSYIYWPGQIDEQFSSTLTPEAQSDVRVYVLLDWLSGNKPGQRPLEIVEHA